MKKTSAEALRRVTETLEAIVSDRSIVDHLPEEERIALLKAAGQVSRPSRYELNHLNKIRRRAKKQREITHDRAARAETGIRTARLSPVYAPPARATDEEKAVVSTEKKGPVARKSGSVMGRGMIVDPRKAKPMLEKTRAAADAMSKSGQDSQAELDKLQ